MRLPLISVLTLACGMMVTSANADDLYDYGEYLSSECVSCHRMDSEYNGIPSIIGWEEEDFIGALLEYTLEERDNPAMVSVAKSLDEEMIKALAYFYSKQEFSE